MTVDGISINENVKVKMGDDISDEDKKYITKTLEKHVNDQEKNSTEN